MSFLYCAIAGIIWMVVIGAICIVASVADKAIEQAAQEESAMNGEPLK